MYHFVGLLGGGETPLLGPDVESSFLSASTELDLGLHSKTVIQLADFFKAVVSSLLKCLWK